MGLFSLISLPSFSDLLYGANATSGTDAAGSLVNQTSEMFLELAPYALAFVGLLLAAGFVKYIVNKGFKGGVNKLIGRKRRRR